MYTLIIFSGINNCATVMDFIASLQPNAMFSTVKGLLGCVPAYTFSQVLVEIPYSLLQSLLCTVL
ncbi:unnamed protein product [Brassica oleracea var. botrytis]|uniref:Uncharacterized protein n=1 Tax=Brassica oleracea TaxID=3712 RepID=A0A3P6ETY7_BRAOL|nr:unnamed protein product [Brassica oleracea]